MPHQHQTRESKRSRRRKSHRRQEQRGQLLLPVELPDQIDEGTRFADPNYFQKQQVQALPVPEIPPVLERLLVFQQQAQDQLNALTGVLPRQLMEQSEQAAQRMLRHQVRMAVDLATGPDQTAVMQCWIDPGTNDLRWRIVPEYEYLRSVGPT